MKIKEVVLTKEEYDKGMAAMEEWNNYSNQIALFLTLLEREGIRVESRDGTSIRNFTDLRVVDNIQAMDGINTKIMLIENKKI
jgi:hypothetical protein